MKDSIKTRKKILALLLSAMTFCSVAAIAACTDESSSDSSSSSSSSSTDEVKDEGLIKNAGFATFDDDNAINTSVTGWTKSTTSIVGSSALSSKAASGIIDLDTEAWHNLTGSNVTVVDELTEETAKAKWDTLTVKDKLAYYDFWKEQNEDEDITEALSFYETMNIDSGDIPTFAWFDTHDSAAAYNADVNNTTKKDTKVLMIHNEYPEASSTSTYKALGTGQQYTSSSTVTVKAGTSAQFSVWVKTADLKCSATDGSVQDAVDKGAFISVTQSVGGKTLDAFKVENINTAGVTDNNGWQQIRFLLKGSSYADTTFTLVLGLGQGSMTYRGEYVNGYAFFDDIECEIISNDDYTRLLGERAIPAEEVIGFADEGDTKEINYAKTAKCDFAFDFYGDFTAIDASFLAALTKEMTSTDGYTSASGSNTAPWLGDGKNATKDVTEVFASAANILAGTGITDEAKKAELIKLYNKYFEGDAAFATEQTLLLMSMDGVAYTAKSASDAIKFSDYQYEGEQADYLVISFFVKTSNMAGYTGAGATIVDGKNKTSFSSIDTSELERVEINDEKLYGDWQQYFFFVENGADDAEKANTAFGMEFTFGPTSVEVDTAIDSYYAGFAAFTGFKVLPLSKAEYESAQSGTYAKVLSVGASTEESTTGDPFDSAKGTPSTALDEGLANPKNYMGVTFDSSYITGGGSATVNTNANAGLISKEYFTAEEGYFDTAAGTYAWLDAIKAASDKTTAAEVWADVFGNSTQPLFIYTATDETQKAAYGYIGSSTEIAANSYVAASVRVKGTVGAKAFIRLVDTNAANYDSIVAYNSPLSISGYRTYWYNDDGNICTGDPAEKATQVAFKLQTNGLYKANASWDKYNELTDKEAWYANLSAYTEKDADGNLLVASGGAKHDYNDYWNNAGMNGIAFYYDKANARYCADEGLKIPVVDLAGVTQLTPRTEATATAELTTEVTLTNDWTTVTFYIHTGDIAKNYRLEVWSGDKNGKGNNVGYVIFDYNNPGTAESNFTGLITEYENKEATEANKLQKLESVFSYFDTASFLRYNKDLDENNVGNLYEDNYTPSAQTKGVAYLYFEESNYITVLADYQYSEKTVAASAAEEEEEEEDSSTDDDADTNVWLLASSLAVAGVLILAIASIVIRKVVIKARRNRRANGGKKKNK